RLQPEVSNANPPPNPSAKNTFLLGSGAVILSSVMFFWGTGLHPRWWLTWLAPLPILLISPRINGRRAFWMAAVALFLGSLNMWFYLLTAVSIPIWLMLLFSVVPGCIFGLAVLLFRRFTLRGDLWKAALSLPVSWVTFEYLNNLASPHA